MLLTLIAVSTTAGAAEPAAPTQSSTAAASSVAVPAEAPASAVLAAAEEAAPAFKPPAGYSTKKKGDQTLYCRKETPIGTRFASEYCFTQEQLQRIGKSSQSMRDDVARRQKTCSGASCMTD